MPDALTLHRGFIQTIVESPDPCLGLGMLLCGGVRTGYVVMRPATPIPARVTNQGFRFGHAMLGDPQDQVMLMSLQFYGATTYHGLVNPSNRVALAVIDQMLTMRDYFFMVLDPKAGLTVFRSQGEEANLVGLRSNRETFPTAQCSPAAYTRMVDIFRKNPNPPGEVLTWIDNEDRRMLDVTNDPLELHGG